MNMRLLILFILLVTLFSSCKKEEHKELVKFKFRYVFVNNGDFKATRITLYAGTFYPEENETFLFSKGKHVQLDGSSYLNTFDSIVYSPELDVYNGCILSLKLQIGFFDAVNIEDIKKYEIIDTIKSDDYKQIRIVWPADSSRFSWE